MKPALGLAVYGVALVVVFGVGAGVGALVGPLDSEPASHQQQPADHDGETR